MSSVEVVSNQVFQLAPFPNRPPGNGLHLLYCIQFTDIVVARKLIHIAVQVLNTHAVEHAMKGPLGQRPERFNSVRMSEMVHGRSNRPLLVAVMPPEVSCKPLVALVLISEYQTKHQLTVFAL